jgi:hypothetical protein
MANKYFNKQVSPKDYKTGGRVGKMGGGMMMMDRPMMKKGGKVKMKKGCKRTFKRITFIINKTRTKKDSFGCRAKR